MEHQHTRLGMKLSLLFFCLLIAVGARAANPAFRDFNSTQFGTNAGAAGNGVRLKDGAVVSNVVDHVTLTITNAANGGSITLSNLSISYRNSSGVLGNYIFFDSGTFLLENGLFNDGVNSALVISNGVIAAMRAGTNSGNFQSATINATGAISANQLIITGGPNWFGQSYMTNGFTATNTDSTKVPMTIGMSGSSTNWFEVRTNGVIAAYGTNDTLNVPKIVAGNLVVATNFSIYASGTAYTLTGSSAALTFGTTSPSLTINLTGTYLITANAGIKYASATYAGAQTATLKLRRTNNTAADLSNGSRAVEMPVLTTFTGGDVFSLPPVIYAATAGDVITIFGILSATPSAGSVQTDSAEIVAVRVAP